MKQLFHAILEKTPFQEGLELLEKGKKLFALTESSLEAFKDYLEEDCVPYSIKKHEDGWIIEYDFKR